MADVLGQFIRRLDWINFWPLVLACAVVAVGSFHRGLEFWKSSRLLEDLPVSRTRSAAQGYVQVMGHIEATPKLPPSPLGDGSRVAWWSLTVHHLPSGSGNNRAAGLVLAYLILCFFFRRFGIHRHETSSNPFTLRDRDGSCEIDPAGARVITGNRKVLYGSSQAEISPMDRVTDSNAAEPVMRFRQTGWGDGDEQHVYQWLNPGEKVYAVGEFATEATLSAPEESNAKLLHKHAGMVLDEWQSHGGELLLRFDTDGDGKLDAREWTRIRRAAMTEARLRLGRKECREVIDRLRKPASGYGFLIVSLDDPALGPALRRKALGWLLTFFLLGSLSIWAINLRLIMGS
jgi:hypothetical protein